MSESNGHNFEGPDQDERTGGFTGGSTGNPTVDAVLESLEKLDDAPVSDHVAVFESAHENLRSALAGAGDDLSS